MANVSVKQIAKFDGTNFQLWKFQITTALVAKGLKGYVDGSMVKPEAAFATWTMNNATAMCLISTAVEYSQVEYLITYNTAQEMWNKLCSIHEQCLPSNLLHLNQKFHAYSMSSCDGVAQHISKVDNMARQLRDLGEQISDTALMAKILGSLPSKYNALVTTWDSMPLASQTVENLRQRLIKEENRLTNDDEKAAALSAVTRKSESSAKNSSRKNGGENNNRSSNTKMKCFYCDKTGHLIRSCRKRKNDIANKNGEANVSAFIAVENSQPMDMFAFSVINREREELLSKDARDAWYGDSA